MPRGGRKHRQRSARPCDSSLVDLGAALGPRTTTTTIGRLDENCGYVTTKLGVTVASS